MPAPTSSPTPESAPVSAWASTDPSMTAPAETFSLAAAANSEPTFAPALDPDALPSARSAFPGRPWTSRSNSPVSAPTFTSTSPSAMSPS